MVIRPRPCIKMSTPSPPSTPFPSHLLAQLPSRHEHDRPDPPGQPGFRFLSPENFLQERQGVGRRLSGSCPRPHLQDWFQVFDLSKTNVKNHHHGGPYKIGPAVHTKTYIFRYFYQQYLVLFTVVPRNNARSKKPMLCCAIEREFCSRMFLDKVWQQLL